MYFDRVVPRSSPGAILCVEPSGFLTAALGSCTEVPTPTAAKTLGFFSLAIETDKKLKKWCISSSNGVKSSNGDILDGGNNRRECC